MKRLSSAEIRQKFLGYFAKQGHRVVASSSLVPGNDPTLLFTNAGMVQFKDVFLGIDTRPYKRATTVQKCMRISGKHNDLENVGPSPRHHTFFEMLGNFSFGDYFKQDAIRYAYELLTQVYELPPDRLAFTVYETDDEAYHAWIDGIGVSPKRVARMGPKTNFWQMAETGPCGPTAEIHWDLTPELGEDGIVDALQREDDRFLELWNLVFMQFNRSQADPNHTGKYDQPLPAPGVDTGLGFERMVMVLQGVETNYDTDLFTDIMDATQEILGHDDAFRREHYVAYRVIADHMRAATFLVADGVNPGNTGREYVPRMLIRRAMRFAHSMGVTKPFLTDVASVIIDKMSPAYPELTQFSEAIHYQIGAEEERFLHTLEHSLAVLNDTIDRLSDEGVKQMSGEDAFFLQSTHGLPLEITRDLLKEHGMSVDEAEFHRFMEKHIEESMLPDRPTFADTSTYQELLASLQADGSLPKGGVAYDPYHATPSGLKTQVIAILKNGQRVETAHWEDEVEIVLAGTPFYVESGGQIGDTGMIAGQDWEVEVTEVRQPVGGLIVHSGKVTQGDSVKEGDEAVATVDIRRRRDIMRNHTATHLLHASLRNVLGEHVRQKGSLVAPDLLRFDFTHNSRMSDEEVRRVTNQVQEAILANLPVEITLKPLDEAKGEGAMALFGEKYGETVRTVSIPDGQGPGGRFSYELCGGTHVASTGEIGPFIITKEESSSAGVRRIVAVTGHAAQQLINRRLETLDQVASLTQSAPETVEEKVTELLDSLDAANQALNTLEQEQAQSSVEDLLGEAVEIGDSKVLISQVAVTDDEMLGWMADRLREHMKSGAVVLGGEIDGKARLVAKVTPDLVERGLHAGNLIKAIARVVEGGGGGRPDFASAGGKNPAKLPDAIAKAKELIDEALS